MTRSDLPRLSRREWLTLIGAGVSTFSASRWFEPLARAAAGDPRRKRSCILLWMNGGPSTIDLWDLKPGHPNGGPYKEISTAVPGIKISEHLPKIAKHTDRMAIVRSMTTKEGDHARAAYYLRTGYMPGGEIRFPPIGALLAKELGPEDFVLPSFVSIAPNRAVNAAAHGPGFLGPQYAPLVVGAPAFVPGQRPGPF